MVSCKRKAAPIYEAAIEDFIGAGNGIRTRDPQLGKLMLCQLSYSRVL